MAEPSSVIERIKQKLDIVEEIGAVVPLKKSGKAYKGLCPFHSERTPSFYVFPERAYFHCFGCNENGDIFTFVQRQQGLDFRDTLTLLAERAGISLEAERAEHAHAAPEDAARKRLRALNEAAAIWFHHQLLQSADAQYARTYLDSRGVSSESIVTWRLGYAPDGDALAAYMLASGYSAQELVAGGLARQREPERGGGLYDAFRQRIIFPIRDLRGQVIGFGGRELGGGQPKYLNSPQTDLFDKSATLFGLDLAREAIRRADRAILVEGYMDAIVTHQYGARNVVAIIGSAITDKHVRQLKKLTRRLALALDPDAAGQTATMRGIAIAQTAFDRVVVPVPGPVAGPLTTYRGEVRSMVRFEEQVDAEITVVRLPSGEDPDEFIRRDAAAWQRAVDQALPLMDYLLETQMADVALDTPAGKAEAAERLLPLIAEMSDRTAQDAYVRRLAARLRVDERELALDFQRVRRQRARTAHSAPARPAAESPAALAAGGAGTSADAADAPGEKYHADSRPAQVSLKSSDAPSEHAGGPARTGLGARLRASQAQEEYCLGVLLERPTTWTEVHAILQERDFLATEMRALYASLAATLDRPVAFELHRFLDDLPHELRAAADHARQRLDPSPPVEGPGLVKVASHAAYRLKRVRLKEEMAELDYLERDAEQSGDREGLRALLVRKQELLAQRRALDAAVGLYG